MTRHSRLSSKQEDEKRSLNLQEKMSRVNAITIGSSLGGPQALKKLLEPIPATFPVPIFITQHICEGFASGFASWLDKYLSLKVKIPDNFESPLPGHVYIAPDNRHMTIHKCKYIHLLDSPPVQSLKPAVSKLFDSALQAYGANLLGILLTGMGNDGSEELLMMKQKGAVTIAQNEETCVAFGMPGSAIKIGGAQHVLPLEAITSYILKNIYCPQVEGTRKFIGH